MLEYLKKLVRPDYEPDCEAAYGIILQMFPEYSRDKSRKKDLKMFGVILLKNYSSIQKEMLSIISENGLKAAILGASNSLKSEAEMGTAGDIRVSVNSGHNANRSGRYLYEPSGSLKSADDMSAAGDSHEYSQLEANIYRVIFCLAGVLAIARFGIARQELKRLKPGEFDEIHAMVSRAVNCVVGYIRGMNRKFNLLNPIKKRIENIMGAQQKKLSANQMALLSEIASKLD